jgi:hypothetical protein
LDDTNDPDPPLLNRTELFWTWSSHCCVGVNPYFALILSTGGLLNSHMPSSATHVLISTLHARTTNSNFLLIIALQEGSRITTATSLTDAKARINDKPSQISHHKVTPRDSLGRGGRM